MTRAGQDSCNRVPWRINFRFLPPACHNRLVGVGRLLIVTGIILLVAGIWITLGWKLPFRLGRLPGDIRYKNGNTVFYFPIVTCVLLSVILTLIVSIFRR